MDNGGSPYYNSIKPKQKGRGVYWRADEGLGKTLKFIVLQGVLGPNIIKKFYYF